MFLLTVFLTALFRFCLPVSDGDWISPTTANFRRTGGFHSASLTPNQPPDRQTKIDPSPDPRSCSPFDPQQCILDNNPSKEPIFGKAPGVSVFTNTFKQTVFSTDILREVFDLSQTTPKQFSDFGRNATEYTLINLGLKEAAAVAEFATRAIAPNFDVLTMPIVARAFANMVANYLFVEGILGIDNAKDLALAFAQSLIYTANASMNSDPTSKFKALSDGFEKFIFSVVERTTENTVLISFYAGNEWFLAAVNYRNG